jgi:hypothetical protein
MRQRYRAAKMPDRAYVRIRSGGVGLANWARFVILNFAEFTSHTLAIADAEMLMGLANTGLGLCAMIEMTTARPARRALDWADYNLRESFCCRFAAGAATIDRRCNF